MVIVLISNTNTGNIELVKTGGTGTFTSNGYSGAMFQSTTGVLKAGNITGGQLSLLPNTTGSYTLTSQGILTVSTSSVTLTLEGVSTVGATTLTLDTNSLVQLIKLKPEALEDCLTRGFTESSTRTQSILKSQYTINIIIDDPTCLVPYSIWPPHEILKVLIKWGKDINEPIQLNGTPLMCICRNSLNPNLNTKIDYVEVAKLLLRQPHIDFYKKFKYKNIDPNIKYDCHRLSISKQTILGHITNWRVKYSDNCDGVVYRKVNKMIETHALIDYIIIFQSIIRVDYVILWILKWLPEFQGGSDLEKIRLMEKIRNFKKTKLIID